MKLNKKFVFLIFIILALLVLWNRFENYKNEKIEKKDFVNYLITKNLLNSDLDSLVNYLFENTKLLMNLEKDIIINSEYNENAYNVYVINYDSLENSKLDDIGLFQKQELLEFGKSNFIAIPNNLILIDAYYLGFLMLDCYNESLAFYQALDEAERYLPDEELYSQHLLTMSSINSYLRINNYHDYKSESDKIVPTLDYAKFMNDLGLFDVFFPYFLTMISHELAHLEEGTSHTSGFFDFDNLVKKNLEIYKEELRADEIALETISVFLDIAVEDDRMQGAVTGLVNFCRAMRDIVIAETYSNFRNIDPEDLIVTLEQKSKISREDLELPFMYLERVEKGYPNDPPAMSRNEFMDFVGNLEKNGSSVAHRHLFKRCYEILSLIDSKINLRIGLFDQYLDLLSIENNQDTLIERLFLQPKFIELNISKEKLLSDIEEEFEFENAINYENNKIQIGYFKNEMGFIEIGGDVDNLNKIEIVLSTRDKNGELSEISIANIAFFLKLVANTFDDEDIGFKKGEEIFSYLRDIVGHYPTFTVKSEKHLFEIIPLNESSFFKIKILPNTAENNR